MKRVLIIIVVFFTILLGALGGVSVYIASLLTEEFLVHQLEGLFNARFALKSYDVSILSGGSIHIEGVAIGPRDRFANKATPLKQRTPMRNKSIALKKLSLELALGKLISGVFRLEGFVLDTPKINMILYANGGNNLSPLFQTPRIVAGKRNPVLDKKKSKPAPKKKKEVTASKGKAAPFKAQDVPIAASLGKIGMENGIIQLSIQKTGDSLRIQNLGLIVKNIEFDPQDLKNKNGADVHFDMQLLLYSKSKKETGKFLLNSQGHIIPFNRRTGRVDPNIIYQLMLKKDSYLAGFSVFEKLSGQMENLKKANISLDKLKEKAVLASDTATKVSYARGVVKILTETKFLTKNFDLIIKKGTHFVLANITHNMRGAIFAPEEDSRKTLKDLDRAISKGLKLNKTEARKMRNKHFHTIIKEDRIYLPFISKGSLSNPDVRLTVKTPSIIDLAKAAGAHLIEQEKAKLKARANEEIKKETEKQKKKALDKAKEAGKKAFKKFF